MTQATTEWNAIINFSTDCWGYNWQTIEADLSAFAPPDGGHLDRHDWIEIAQAYMDATYSEPRFVWGAHSVDYDPDEF